LQREGLTLNKRIAVLALANFAMGTEAFVYAGHLETLAADLGQSVAAAGQLASAFAITCALTAPLIAGAVAHLPRRAVLVAGLCLIGALNLLAALAATLPVLLGLRTACGLAAGLVGPIASLAAAELAPPEQRGKAMGIVLAGMTLAFVLGIPIGSVIGDIAGWRGTFAYAGVIALVAALAIRLVLPSMPGGARTGISSFKAALEPAVAHPLALTLIGFSATFATIAYIGPVVTAISGLTGSGIGAMQALIGVGSIIGIVIGIKWADHPKAGRVLVLSFIVSALALSLYSLLLRGAPVNATAPMLSSDRGLIIAALSLGMIAGAAALFARTPIIQSRLVAAAPTDARPVALALNGSMVFLGQGLGAALGGLALTTGGIGALGYAAAATAVVGAGLACATTTPSRPSAIAPEKVS
jgi:MFS transporter, DHA1 family, inner membrane transport protein